MKKTGLSVGIVVTALTVSLLSGCNSVPQKPAEEILKEGVAKLAQVTSATYNVSLKGDIKDPSSTDVTFDTSASGLFDIKDMKLPKLAIKLTGSASDKSGMAGTVGAEVRLDKDMAYFNIMKVDSKMLPLPPDVTALMNKWWSSKVPQEIMDQLQTSTTTSSNVGGTQESKFKALLAGANLFSKPTLVGTESVGGESSWHFKTGIDNAGVVALMKKASEQEGTTVSAEEEASVLKEMAKVNIIGDVWVGTQSGVLNKFEGTLTLAGAAGEPSGSVTLKMELGGINQSQKVDVPAPIEEFTMDKAAPIMMMLQGGAPADSSSLGGDLSGGLSEETPSGIDLTAPSADGSLQGFDPTSAPAVVQ